MDEEAGKERPCSAHNHAVVSPPAPVGESSVNGHGALSQIRY